jgi:hypothetical protein
MNIVDRQFFSFQNIDSCDTHTTISISFLDDCNEKQAE